MLDLIDDFSNWLVLSGRNPTTADRHKGVLKILLRYCLDNGGFNSQTVGEFLVQKKASGARNAYLDHFVASAKIFTQFLKDKSLQFDEKLLALKYFKQEYFEKATMSDEEIEAFLSLPLPISRSKMTKSGVQRQWHNSPRSYKKWTMFFTIMAYTGMRPGEVAHLSVNDVDFGRDVFIAHETKSGHQGQTRYVPIAPNIKGLVSKHICKLNSKYLFPSEGRSKSEVVRNVDWGYNFHTRIKRLGIKRTNLSPYSLRHSLITRLLEEDVNLFKVQKLAGHRRLETTARYTHLTTKDLQRAIYKHPMVVKNLDPSSKMANLKQRIEECGILNDTDFECEILVNSNSLYLKVKKKRV